MRFMHSKDETIILVMLETIGKIMLFTSGLKTAEEFAEDVKSFDATIMNFIILGESVDKLSESFKKIHSDIDWREIYDFRNVLAHDYFGIYPAEVWEIIQKHLPILKAELEAI